LWPAGVGQREEARPVGGDQASDCPVSALTGAALMPCLIGDQLKDLVRLTMPIQELSTACWLVTTDAARRQPHIRAVIDAVVAEIERTTQRREPDALSA